MTYLTDNDFLVLAQACEQFLYGDIPSECITKEDKRKCRRAAARLCKIQAEAKEEKEKQAKKKQPAWKKRLREQWKELVSL